MNSSDIKQHLTVKNIFIAIVAMNILSAFSLNSSNGGGTFQETSKPAVRPVQQVSKAPPASDPALIAHMVPGEASPAQVDGPAAQAPPVRPKPPAQIRPQRKIDSDPPNVGWLMLFFVGAMALYVRYLMQKAMWNAAAQIGDIVRQVATAAARMNNTKAAPVKPSPPVQPGRSAKPTSGGARSAVPRKSTVVRASRWPLFS